MKKTIKSLMFVSVIALFVSLALTSCKKKEIEEKEEPTDTVTMRVTVDLDANKAVIRTQEALIGNMVADANKEMATTEGITVDFAVENGGNMRFSAENRPSGIYTAGIYTDDIISEIAEFNNDLVVVTVTGTQLKEIFERSVSSLPDAKGWFLQVSKELKVVVDKSKQAQVLNETDPLNPTIATAGERIVSIKLNNVEINPTSTYKVVTSTYMSEGNDGFVTYKGIASTLKTDVGKKGQDAIKAYLKAHSPVTPAIEGRITFVE
jgi:5'-nucleotidase/UDP-sugar diphosphatase